jgi:Uma2 family endonuclease
VVVRDRPDLPAAFRPADVALVVEVTSPHREGWDWVTKRAVYARAGIPVYVVADRGQLTVLDLDTTSRSYTESASGKSVTLHQPFTVTLSA